MHIHLPRCYPGMLLKAEMRALQAGGDSVYVVVLAAEGVLGVEADCE